MFTIFQSRFKYFIQFHTANTIKNSVKKSVPSSNQYDDNTINQPYLHFNMIVQNPSRLLFYFLSSLLLSVHQKSACKIFNPINLKKLSWRLIKLIDWFS